jgi:hypothetical protein
MKLLTLRDLDVEDSLALFFEGAFDPRAELKHALEPFLQALEEYAGEWMPDIVKSTRRRGYSRAAVWKALEERRSASSSIIGLYRTMSPAVALTLDLGLTERRPELSIGLNVQPLSFFTEAERCRRFADLVRAWASHYPVPYASAHSIADEQLAGSPHYGRDEETSRRDGFDKVYAVFWLNVFGPKLVETVGRERMLSTPAHRVEELPDGSVLLMTWPTAADFASEEARRAQARALVHLRPDLDWDAVLRGLRERSTTLAPVEPRFHPDVEPLLSQEVDRVAISERQRKIAELNAWLPPEPEEWLPVHGYLPSDVEDPDLAIRRYGDLALGLVECLYTVFQATPGSLTDLDSYFLSTNFLRNNPPELLDEQVVHAVGAHLGEVLVRNLGGQWIPRKKLEEAQVRVGDRMWLPFLRAHRYMRSRQAVLDYSLTQFYRVAERHRS